MEAQQVSEVSEVSEVGHSEGHGSGEGHSEGHGNDTRRQHGNRNRSNRTRASMQVPVLAEYIGVVIGSKGAMINKIQDTTGTRISHREPNMEEGHQSNIFHITGDPTGVKRASNWIIGILKNTYNGQNEGSADQTE